MACHFCMPCHGPPTTLTRAARRGEGGAVSTNGLFTFDLTEHRRTTEGRCGHRALVQCTGRVRSGSDVH
eukprot:1786783-Alexandrium_andersonii.AAC.1